MSTRSATLTVGQSIASRARFAFAAIVLILATVIVLAISTSSSVSTTSRPQPSSGATVESPQTVGGEGPAQFHPLP